GWISPSTAAAWAVARSASRRNVADFSSSSSDLKASARSAARTFPSMLRRWTVALRRSSFLIDSTRIVLSFIAPSSLPEKGGHSIATAGQLRQRQTDQPKERSVVAPASLDLHPQGEVHA